MVRYHGDVKYRASLGVSMVRHHVDLTTVPSTLFQQPVILAFVKQP